MDALGLALKAARPGALAVLTRVLGDWHLAEDALQEATVRALKAWATQGVPDNPTAWLVRTGRNYAIDEFRKNGLHRRHACSLALLQGAQPGASLRAAETLDDLFNDDLMRLVFTCCHPALSQEAQVALTLKTVAGLSVAEIARAFVTTAKTMERRITRAKTKIRDANIPYEVPAADQLPRRLAAVLSVVYLIFNEGHTATRGPDAARPDLAAEAIRLGRLLAVLFRGETEVAGLLALMLLHHARRHARIDAQGDFIPIDRQDRTLWDTPMIAEGRALLEQALRQRRPGTYQVQAAIAAVHATARDAAGTAWEEIAQLYCALERYEPSPVITLNRAVAVAHAAGPRAGLDLLTQIEGRREMQRYAHFFAVKGALLKDCGDHAASRAAYERARQLTENEREIAYLNRKIAELGT